MSDARAPKVSRRTMTLLAGASVLGAFAVLRGDQALWGMSQGSTVALSIAEFGARSGPSFDSTDAVARAVRAAAASGKGIYIPVGRYHVREVRLLNGVRFVEGPGWLVGTSARSLGVITTNDLGSPGIVNDLRISANVDCNNVARNGIFCVGLRNSRISGSRVMNLSTNGGNGIRLNFPNCSGNLIENNMVTLAADEPYGRFPDGLFGIHVVGETTSTYGGFDRHPRPVYAAVTVRANRVIRNRIFGGTHGIAFFGAEEFNCANNHCEGQSHRNIIAGPVCRHGVISGNMCVDAASCGVHLALGCSDITIARNRVTSTRASRRDDDDGAIQAYIHCTDIRIDRNEISGDFRYGIFVAYAANVSITDNVIDGRNFSAAGIAIASAFSAVALPGATYSRHRPPFRVDLDTSDILIRGNTVIGSPASIALAQIGDHRLRRIRIEGGRIGEGATHYIHAYEQSAGRLQEIEIVNVATPGGRRFVMPRGRQHFTRIEGVPGL